MSRVSVVVTCYNQDEYIGDAIGSVVRQTRYDEISEVIIVDDGSEDDSGQVIREWDDRCEKVHRVYQENLGVAAARNTGIQRSSSDFVAFLDGDDIWLEERLEVQLHFLDRNPGVGLLYTDVYAFGEEVEGRKRGYCSHYEHDDENVLRDLFAENGTILPSTALISRECLQTVGLFDRSLPQAEDPDLWLRIAGEHSIHHINEPLVLKRQRNDSLTADFEKNARYLIRVTDKIADLYPKLRPFRGKRKARVYSGLARNRAVSGERKGAVQAAIRAISHDFYSLSHYLTLVFAVLPVSSSQLQWLRERIQEAKLYIRRYTR